jgi:pimeloyl-ACP methyl ester carboxylesterase
MARKYTRRQSMPPRKRIVPSSARPATLAAAARAAPDYGVSDQPDWRSVAWRPHLRAVTIDGRRVHVVDIGSGAGTPVVFIHGLSGRWQNWLENIPPIAAHRRAIALDLPGFGRSQLPTAPISIPHYAAVLDRLCDLLELESVLLVGTSMGGAVAAEAALRFPERVERLVLVSPAAVSITDFNPAPAAALLAALARTPLGTPDGMRAILGRRRARHLALAMLVRHPTRIRTDILWELIGGRAADGVAGAWDALIGQELRGQLSAIAQPTLIVHGREDMLVPVADSAWLSKQLPNARLEVFHDTGHLAMLERPVRFNELLLDFAQR